MQLLLIDLGDSTLVKVEKGDAFNLPTKDTLGSIYWLTPVNPSLIYHPFTNVRAAIDAIDALEASEEPPVPRLVQSGEGYRLFYEGSGTYTDTFLVGGYISSRQYQALCELAGVTISVWTPKKRGEWVKLLGGTNCLPCEVWRYTCGE